MARVGLLRVGLSGGRKVSSSSMFGGVTFLMTRPRIPESEIKMLEPLPRMVNGRFATEFFRCSLPSGCPPAFAGVTRSLRFEKLIASSPFFLFF